MHRRSVSDDVKHRESSIVRELGAAQLVERIRRRAARTVYGPRVYATSDYPLRRLGSTYGGWTFADAGNLSGCRLISCGLGEDASFEVAFASLFDAQVLFVDPTPRAVMHFAAIQAHIGEVSSVPYAADGHQPIAAYDLSRIDGGQISLIEAAVSDRRGEAKFFEPPNPHDVSYSLLNFQNDYVVDTPHIVVPTIPIEDLFHEPDGSDTILKLDIEGAEVTALIRLMGTSLRPSQILVEYDELSRPSRWSRSRFYAAHDRLVSAGYRPTFFDGRTCVSYLYAGFSRVH